MRNWIGAVRLYLHYVSVNIRCAMQYKASLLLMTTGQMLISFSTFFGIHFMFMRFDRVAGYGYSDVLLCFAIVMMQFTLAEMFARGFDAFSGTVRKGEFDRILVRPRSTVLQVLGSKFECSRIGRLVQAVIVFIYGVAQSDVVWTLPRIGTLVMMLAGGAVLFASLFQIYASLCFFTLEGLEFMNVFTDGAREYGKYPVDVYGKRVLQFSTVIIPYALVQAYPLQYLLGRSGNALLMLCPLGVVFFAALSHLIWRFGVAHYTSSGS